MVSMHRFQKEFSRFGSYGVAAALCGTAIYGSSSVYQKYKQWEAKSREQEKSLKGLDTIINCINSFSAKITNPEQPVFTKLIGSGKAKLVFAGYRNADLPPGTPHTPSNSAKIEDLAYIIARNPVAGDELRREIQDGQEIKHYVFFANLKIFMESLGQSKDQAGISAAILIAQFPTIEDLIKGLERKDRRLNLFLEKSPLSSTDPYRNSLRRLIESCLHLAVDLVDASNIVVHGKPAVVAKMAQNNLENVVRQNSHEFPAKGNLVMQLMKGFRELHAAGYVHGDIKLENILVYSFEGNPIIKIADWGKCKKLDDTQIGLHTGNLRHMAPERLSSQKGEVFGVALMVIRMLEEEFLTASSTQMLISPEEIDAVKEQRLRDEINPAKCRKGIERYLSISKGCPEEDANPIDMVPHIFDSFLSLFQENPKNIDVHLDRYLNTLQLRLEKKYGNTDEEKAGIQDLMALLQAMTRSEKAVRITMEEAVPRLEACLASFQG